MCGIAGYISIDLLDHSNDVHKMLSVIQHRGPNGQGIFNENGVTLGHRRLSIIDLSDQGRQPMSKEHLVITFNGEIYNYIELRKQLEKKGYIYRSHTDTEVVLTAYAEWGPSCVERFDGMWAFAIFDKKNKQLFCSRDRFGEKPFFYYQDPAKFIFSSEPKQLHAINLVRYAEQERVIEFIIGEEPCSPDRSYFQDIKLLQPGSSLLVDIFSLGIHEWRYYKPGSLDIFKGIRDEEVSETFKTIFNESILMRLRSDVPVGLLLSGGIDSSLIAALAGPLYYSITGKKLKAVTSSGGYVSNDESSYAKLVAESCNIEWIKVNTDASKIRDYYREATRIQERPLSSGSVVAQMLTMRAAKEQGITVLLDGQGADESWLGYPRYIFTALRMMPLRQRFSIMFRNIENSGLGFLPWLLNYIYFQFSHVRSFRAEWLLRNSEIAKLFPEVTQRLVSLYPQSASQLRNMQYMELQGQQLGRLLHYEDRNSMSFSLESRLPFLNYRLVELSLAVAPPIMFRDGWSKWPLRNYLSLMVPRNIAWRKRKIGFETDPNSFDPSDPEYQLLIEKSDLINSVGFQGMKLADMPTKIAWRIYALATWEEVCKVHI